MIDRLTTLLVDRLFHFEHRSEALLPYRQFFLRLVRSAAFGLLFVVIALAVGVVGYKITSGGFYTWSDAFYNASMILGGMGPVDDRGLRIPEAEK